MVQWIHTLPKWLVLELVIPLTLLNSWLLFLAFRFFQPLPTVLVIAMLLSFLLDYPVQFLQKRSIPRSYAVLIIILGTLGVAALLGINLMPQFIQQLRDLTTRLPTWIESGDQQFEAWDTWLRAHDISLDLSEIAAQFSSLLPHEIRVLPNQMLELVLGTADRILEVILTLALTIYLLLHGEAFWKGIFQWLPESWGDRLRQTLKDQFQNYFVGQAMIAALMALVLTVAFFLLEIPFWLVFGLGIGAMVLIPFGDSLSILVVSVLVSLKSIGLGGEVLAIAVLTDQVIDNAVAPRILSDRVGLNPVWIIISLFIGVQLGGVLGMVIAVPLAASIKQLSVN